MAPPKDEAFEDDENEDANDDVYEEEEVERELDDDEINDNEAGMLEGFDRDESKTFGDNKKRKK